MADTCIVCLSDLCAPDFKHLPTKDEDDSTDQVAPSAQVIGAPGIALVTPAGTGHDGDGDDSCVNNGLIAHILPCGHNIHDSCLKPWVERANSCPICRATFNMVELRQTLHGPAISSYPVQDKIQVAEIDHSSLSDDAGVVIDIESIPPCMVCQSFGDEGTLLLCDGCNQSCHIFCAGLDDIPTGSWFCYDCQSDPRVWVQSRSQDSHRRRANGTGRRRDARNTAESRAETMITWARLWRSVATRTNIDLDFPFSELGEPETDNTTRISHDQREFRSWQRRFQVAARAAGPGAANRFREIASIASQLAAPESQEEIKAWNAFEKARIILEDSDIQDGRKRRSRSTTPSQDRPPEPERKRKRPRTMVRVHENDALPDGVLAHLAESSRAPSRNAPIAAPRPSTERFDSAGGPTFLQSLLEEVESHPLSDRKPDVFFDINGEYFPYGCERSASTDGSSPNSGYATPRSMTPPPLRPVSPSVPASYVTPIFPPAPEFLPNSTTTSDSVERARSRQRAHLAIRSPESSPPRFLDKSRPKSQVPPAPPTSPRSMTPAKHQLGLQAKKVVQSLVQKVLKGPYRAKQINAEQFTHINKTVCYRLYEQIGTEDNLTADESKWQAIATEQVKKALAHYAEKPMVFHSTEDVEGLMETNRRPILLVRGS